MLQGNQYPHLTCPNCRATHDLEADIEDNESEWEEAEVADEQLQLALEVSKQPSSTSKTSQVDQNGDSIMVDAPSIPPPPAGVPQRAAPSPPSQQHPNGGLSFIEAGSFMNPISLASTPPRNIPGRNGGSRIELLHPNGSGQEGPMTPRNDAGPFVLDGGAGTGGAAGAGAQGQA
jgi:hypothetical protein